MRKSDIVDRVFSSLETKHTKKDIGEIFDACLLEIRKAVEAKDAVTIQKFGTFRWFKSKPRKAKNIEGEDIVIPEKESMKFKSSEAVFEGL